MASSLRATLLRVSVLAMLMISISPSFAQQPELKPMKTSDPKMPAKDAPGTEHDPEEKRKNHPKHEHPKTKGKNPGKGESEDLKRVCNSTAYYQKCVQIFTADPRAATADYLVLGEIAIDMAFAQAKDIISTLASLAKGTSDHRLKRRLGACGKYYQTTFANLENAKKYLRKRDFQKAEDEALDALEESGACEGHFVFGEPEEPKILSQKNKEFEFRVALCPVAIEWLLAKK